MTHLVDRERERAVLDSFVGSVDDWGGALVIVGEAGIGKSSLAAYAHDLAVERGATVLATAGVQSEANLPFAGLHQLLRPVLTGVGDLPAAQRRALETALGLSDAAPPDLFLVALATLALLVDVTDQRLMVVVEDAQWLDRATTDVLGFVARRLDADPVLMILVIRDGYATPLRTIGLRELPVGSLDAKSAAEVLDVHLPHLDRTVRALVLDEAQGNPLALIELPIVLGSRPSIRPRRHEPLPITLRLERAFAARVEELPPATTVLLLVAAADDGDTLTEILAAAAEFARGEFSVRDLSPAVAAGLVAVQADAISFRHPLVRSAIYQAANLADRLQAHQSLSAVIADPDRRVWHRAASMLGADEDTAHELEEAALRALSRGAPGVALAALERAAQLSVLAPRRRRLLLASELAIELGEPATAAGLLRGIDASGLSRPDAARLTLVRSLIAPPPAGDARTVTNLLEIASGLRSDGAIDVALRVLDAAARQAWWSDPGADARHRIVSEATAMPVGRGDPRVLSILSLVDPEGHGQAIIESGSSLSQDQVDPDTAKMVGAAMNLVGAFDLSAAFLATAAAGFREQARLGSLPEVLTQQAWTAINMLDWNTAVPAAAEASRLADETGQLLWGAAARAGESMLAGLRGDVARAEELARRAEAVAVPLRASAVLCGVQLTRGVTAIGAGRYEEAFDHLHRVFDPADPAYHRYQSSWALGDLAEAAMHTEQVDRARDIMAGYGHDDFALRNPWLATGMLFARPLLATASEAEDLFHAGLAADLSRWPFYRARLLLHYGTWLRRQRRVAQSRGPLRASREAFDALGVLPWAERARSELRAAGEASNAREEDTWSLLSPQEHQIAQLAASGLTNREIGQKLYLSHRTVGSHLYRIFPKLGITSRTQLSALFARES